MDFFLKNVALLAMALDHFALLHVSDQSFWHYFLRDVGRIAFPVFEALVVYNFLYRTSSRENMLLRLLLFAAVSQPIYFYVMPFENLNILFTLFFVLLGIHLLENRFYVLFLLYLVAMREASNFYDYGFFGILWGVSVYLFYKTKNFLWLLFGILHLFLVNGWIVVEAYAKGFSVLGVAGNLIGIIFGVLTAIFVFSRRSSQQNETFKKCCKNFRKFFFYLFYPIHIAVLGFFAF